VTIGQIILGWFYYAELYRMADGPENAGMGH
jgi:hypothetical protein